MFKVKGTVVTLPGRGRKRKLTMAIFLTRNPLSDCKRLLARLCNRHRVF